MKGRYYITGVQIGIIKAMTEKHPEVVLDLVNKIEELQYLGEREDLEVKR